MNSYDHMPMFEAWKCRTRELKRDTLALSLACRDSRSPWYAKAIAALVVGYAFSPIDLIPDFIPVIGLLDDFVLVPLGIMLVLRLIPTDVMDYCRLRAEHKLAKASPFAWIAAAVIILIWGLLAAVSYRLIDRANLREIRKQSRERMASSYGDSQGPPAPV